MKKQKTMFKAYKYRIYPNNKQKEFFEKTFGCVRFYWNKALEIKLKVFEENKGKSKDERKSIPRVLPSSLKKEYPFLKEVDSLALANAQLNLERALNDFFKGKTGMPKFKRKKARQSYTTNSVNNSIRVDFEKGTIRLPKIGNVKAKLHRTFDGIIKSATVEKTHTGKYFASILVEEQTKENIQPTTDKICAVDVGLKDYAVIADSAGNIQKIPHPKWITEVEKRIKRAQRKLAKKQKGSKNREKQRLKLAKLQEKLRNQIEDFLHKLSKTIISDNQAVVVEDLNVKGLLSNRKVSKHIHHSSWGKFFSFLQYKAQFYGRKIIEVDRYYPSSKMCSVCGNKNEELTLSDREWKCDNCGTNHDRDINAALNLLKYGLAYLNGGRAGTARTQACGDCSGGGMGITPVYEPSVVEAGSSIFYKME